MEEWKCTVCAKEFSTHSNLSKHLKILHGYSNMLHSYSHRESSKISNNKCLERNCNESFTQNEKLIQHLEVSHDMPFEREHLEFSDMIDFSSWKVSVEGNNNCRYKLKAKSGPISYYECHRPGKLQGVAKVPKVRGSCKLDRTCTSIIKASTVNEKIDVMWVKTHYGHAQVLRDLTISKLDRACIASKLAFQVSSSGILDSLARRTDTAATANTKLVTSKDIKDVEKSLNPVMITEHDTDKESENSDDDDFDLLQAETCKLINNEAAFEGIIESDDIVDTTEEINYWKRTATLDLQTSEMDPNNSSLTQQLSTQIETTFSSLQKADLDKINAKIAKQIHCHLNAIGILLSLETPNENYCIKAESPNSIEVDNEKISSDVPPNPNIAKYKYINSKIVKRHLNTSLSVNKECT